MARRRRRFRDQAVRAGRPRPSILRGVINLARRGPWCLPLAGGLVACVLLALVLPAFVTWVVTSVDVGQLQPLIEKASGRPVRLFAGLGVVAFLLGAAMSAWRFASSLRPQSLGQIHPTRQESVHGRRP
jgi:hypothetical protein